MFADRDAISALLATRHPSGDAPAAAICVHTDEKAESSVVAPPDTTAPFAADAPFIVYSITKTLLATAALMLVAQQMLALDLPITRWLPTAPHADRITLRHLLRHASGLPDYGALPAYHEAVRRGDQPWSDAEFLANTRADTLLFPPGLGWRYSNIGYMIVRRLLEAVQTAPMQDILRDVIFAPLGLAASYVVTTDAQLAELTFGPSAYLGSAAQPVAVAARYHIAWVAHGAVAAPVTEIAAFFHALLGGHVLPDDLLREMCTYTPLPTMPDRPVLRPGYGLGLQIDHGLAAGPIYGHSGGGPGAQLNASSLRGAPTPITVVVATTGEDLALTEEIAMHILQPAGYGKIS